MRRLIALLKDQFGNVAVEFGLVAPVFIALVVGVADYGMVARDRSLLEAAARAGVQAVINDADDIDGATTAAEAVDPGADIDVDESCTCRSDGSAVACDGSCASGGMTRTVTVTATKPHSLLAPWPGFDDPFEISAVARARVE